MSTRIKFCGCSTWADVTLAIDTGADAVGMIFAPSPRGIDSNAAAEIAQRIGTSIVAVGVFVDPSIEDVERARWLFPHLVVQLSGNESPEFVRAVGEPVVKGIHVGEHDGVQELRTLCDRYAPAMPLFDTKVDGMYGGTGRTFPWPVAASIARSRDIVVAGGLTPENVGDCIRTVRPAWVDVRSGIESGGRKDALKMERFVAAVREADEA
ncbi:MAG TPA: phosphoribosylanthranilate isomerase [Candidatus Baltobacteraceae bacterium]|nr:phosphoribosylanthranilate isomerase [Candidatus Baltobacteraceae bacterium]